MFAASRQNVGPGPYTELVGQWGTGASGDVGQPCDTTVQVVPCVPTTDHHRPFGVPRRGTDMNTHGAQDLRARTATRVVAAVAIGAGLLLSVIGAAVSSSAAQAASPAAKGSLAYSATATIPVPLPSKFAGSAGGDGWAVATNATEIFNVFHHAPTLQVNCHLKSNAEPCWAGPETIKDAQNHDFATSDAPGLYLDPDHR